MKLERINLVFILVGLLLVGQFDFTPLENKSGQSLTTCVFSAHIRNLAPCASFLTGFTPLASAATVKPAISPEIQKLSKEELEQQLKDRAAKLEDINNQLSQTRQSLTQTQGERISLQRELTTLQGNVKQLSLGIKSDEITNQKLSLEIQSIQYELTDIDYSIDTKHAAIGAMLQELSHGENANLMTTLLQQNSLAESVQEGQALIDLHRQLQTDIAGLKTLTDAYQQKLSDMGVRKTKIASHQQDLENKKIIIQDQKDQRQQILSVTKNKESLYLAQMTALQIVQQSIADEVEALDATLRAKINPGALPGARHGVLGSPINPGDGVMTQGYGSTSFAKYGYRGKWHNGVDFGVSIGTPILAAESGTVVASGNQDLYCPRGAYGKFIAVNHNNGLTTLYGHLSRQIVSAGDKVERGQVIGYSGRTGYATGPHLHLTVYAQSTFYMGQSKTCGKMPFGGDLDPTKYL